MQSDERPHPFYGIDWPCVEAFEIGQWRQIGRNRTAAEQRNRNVAKPRVLGERGQERIDGRRAIAFADEYSVELARHEIACGAFDAERADQADPFADRRRKL